MESSNYIISVLLNNLLVNTGVLNKKADLINGIVPLHQLPPFILEYNSFEDFPENGESKKIYLALDSNRFYYWNGNTYIPLFSDGGVVYSVNGFTGNVVLTTKDIDETDNLYFTEERVRNAISVLGGNVLSYNKDTGVISYTPPTTSDIPEGVNLYYTNERVYNYLTTNNYATQLYVSTQINNLINNAPGLLDTLDELAAALGDDPNFSATVTTALSNRLRVDINNQNLTDIQRANGRANLSLGELAVLSNIGDDYITDISYSKITGIPSTFPPYQHNHNDLYYTKTEIGDIFIGATAISGYNKTNWDAAYSWGNHSLAGYLKLSDTNLIYQPLNINLTAISNISGNGLLMRDVNNVWSFVNEIDRKGVSGVVVDGIIDKTITINLNDGTSVSSSWTDLNTFVTLATFSNGILSLSRNDSAIINVSLDGRYLQSESDTLASVTARGATTNTKITLTGGTYGTWNPSLTAVSLKLTGQYQNLVIRPSDDLTTGQAVFLIQNSTVTQDLFYIRKNGQIQSTATITASSFIVTGGTSSQFLKANGSVDSTNYVKLDGINIKDGTVLEFKPATSGGYTFVKFSSNKDNGNDKGWILTQDNSLFVGSGGGNPTGQGLRMTIGVSNDFGPIVDRDELWLQGGGRMVFNTGLWDSEYNSIVGAATTKSGGDAYVWKINDAPYMRMDASGILYITGNVVLHANNYYNYALPLSGNKTVSGLTTFSSGISFSTDKTIKGENLNLGFYSGNDGFLFYQNVSHPTFHIGGYGNAAAAGYANEDGLITLVRGDGSVNTSNKDKGLSNSIYYTNIIKTTGETIFIDGQKKHRFTGSVGIAVNGTIAGAKAWNNNSLLKIQNDTVGDSSFIEFTTRVGMGDSIGIIFTSDINNGYVINNETDMLYGTKTDHIFQNGNTDSVGGKTETFRIFANGDARAVGDVIAYSDIRIKENIYTIDDAIEKVIKLRGVYYNKINKRNERKVGVIAQEIMNILPEVVSMDENGIYSVAYGNITALLIEAIKEQENKIRELEKRLLFLNNV